VVLKPHSSFSGISYLLRLLDNIVADFDYIWKGYKREIVGKGWIDIHEKAKSRAEFKRNYDMAKRRAADGDHVKILPVHEGYKWKSPDYLINASLWELESPNGSKSSIDRAIREGQKQALNLIIEVPETADRKSVLKYIYNRFTRKDSPARIRNLIFYHGDEKNQWTADQIKRWDIK